MLGIENHVLSRPLTTRPLTFGFGSNQSLADATWTLAWDSSRIRIWTPVFDENGDFVEYVEQQSGWSGQVADENGNWYWWQNGVGAWVEAVDASQNLDDIEFMAMLDLDGANATTRDEVKDTVKATAIAGDLGFNNADTEAGVASPDTTFKIDAADDLFDEIKDGVDMWWGRRLGFVSGGVPETINVYDLEDAQPFRVDMSDVPANFSGQNQVIRLSAAGLPGDAQLEIYSSAADAQERLKYLTDPTTAQQQINKTRHLVSAADSAEFTLTGGSQEFILRPVMPSGQSVAWAVTLTLQVKNGKGEWINLDNVRLTLRSIESFWAMWSSRGDAQATTWRYPIEDGRTAKIKLYPEAHFVPSLETSSKPFRGILKAREMVAPEGNDIFIFIHGYNTTSASAVQQCNWAFKRTFWTGFRGSFVGYTWEGDEWNINPLGQRSLFDPNVYNAFQSAPSFKNFLVDTVSKWSDNTPQRVNIMAHSLGNLVMFEGLRLAERALPQNAKIVNNVIAVEAAIWKEAFEPQTPLTYPSQGYDVDDVDSNKVYSTDDQKKHSWRFWFRQLDKNGNERNLKRLITGKMFNSFNPDDYALNFGMRVNDHLMRSVGAGHYNRHGALGLSHLSYRTLTDNPLNDASMEHIPSLMTRRSLGYWYNDLNLPVGAGMASYFDENVPSRDVGWPEVSHGAAFYFGDTPNGFFQPAYDVSMPVMWGWYQRIFRFHQAVRIGH